MKRIKQLPVQVLAWLLNPWADVAVLSMLSGMSLAIGLFTDWVTNHPRLAFFSQLIIWTLILSTLIFWFNNHRKNRARRTLELTKAMMMSDSAVRAWITPGRNIEVDQAVDELRMTINSLLERLCGLLAYRVPSSEKGATFLIPTDNTNTAKLGLFAHAHHDDVDTPSEIHRKLSLEHGLAAKAIEERGCIIIRDCSHAAEETGWIPTRKNPRYLGRAAVPVRGRVDNASFEFGALCFDVRRAWELDQEDQELLLAFADKIASICAIWLELDQNSRSFQMMQVRIHR